MTPADEGIMAAKMETAATHSPLPWIADDDGRIIAGRRKDGLGGVAVAELLPVAGGERYRANKCLIVTAVNHHAELVEMVRLLADTLGSRTARTQQRRLTDAAHARALLAKIEQEGK